MNSEEALAFIWEKINEHFYIVVLVVIFIWLSIILGIIMSGVVLTCKNITGTFGFFANILLVAIGVGFLFLGSFISQVLSLTAKLWLYSIPSLLPGIATVTVGVMGMLHLAPCIKARGKVCRYVRAESNVSSTPPAIFESFFLYLLLLYFIILYYFVLIFSFI